MSSPFLQAPVRGKSFAPPPRTSSGVGKGPSKAVVVEESVADSDAVTLERGPKKPTKNQLKKEARRQKKVGMWLVSVGVDPETFHS